MSEQKKGEELDRAAQDIRNEYARRVTAGPQVSTGQAMFESRLRAYDEAMLPVGSDLLKGKRVLDLGCANGKWLDICCSRWNAAPDHCVGVDLREELIQQWRTDHPESEIQLYCQSAHEMEFQDASFDLVHHSMMLSSVPDPNLRGVIAQQMWRVLRPGGHLMSYDFWINPTNPKTVGIGLRRLKGMFPTGLVVFRRKMTLVPHLTRLLNKMNSRLPLALERLRFLNTHLLVVIRKLDD
ncbi:MAG: class I SAM-dependent methyltransferase [Planctomycetes bacterium]|nr:class I SAM-dependent methyltransferase [Planctomycetota bacterium]